MSDHRSPLEDRWGGWYVTGGRGITHLGNRPITGPRPVGGVDGAADPTPAFVSLDGRFDTSGYLTPYSDVMALMVLEHQTHMTNLLTRMGWETRVAGSGREDADARVRDTAVELGRLSAVRQGSRW